MEVDWRTLLARSILIELHIISQLGLLLFQLRGAVLATLSNLGAEPEYRQVQLEDLVLDLAYLQSCACCRLGTAGRLNGLVETTCINLGSLCRLARRLDDL